MGKKKAVPVVISSDDARKLSDYFSKCSEIFQRISEEVAPPVPDLSKQDGHGQKRKRDPNEPKRTPSAYILFCKDQRDATHAENPEVDPKTITKLLAEKWSSLSEREKSVYEKLREQSQEKYLQDKAKYELSKKEANDEETDLEEDTPSLPSSPAKKPKTKAGAASASVTAVAAGVQKTPVKKSTRKKAGEITSPVPAGAAETPTTAGKKHKKKTLNGAAAAAAAAPTSPTADSTATPKKKKKVKKTKTPLQSQEL
ncbi:hypothetical protein H4219_004195 [Mycoemilia scoparia]|uniref:HMG box domain-containing protein n=1 Tax=Mycoemilia scoparia TaxID=417184 RepID=A0A9W8DLU3_9FUNG|nr:hypothetical protein H4219_004195 [Mycoemilia scoparia]